MVPQLSETEKALFNEYELNFGTTSIKHTIELKGNTIPMKVDTK